MGDIKNSLPGIRPMHYALVILTYNALTESLIIIDNILEYFFPVPLKLRLRLSLQFISGFILLMLAYKLSVEYIDPEMGNSDVAPYMYTGMVIGLLLVSIITNILTISRMTEKWYFSTRQLDIMKQEKLQMDYNSLQDKLNPHFLFNNLSVLKGLIYTNIDEASGFIENFSDVYRYVLKSSDKQLVRVSEELEFLNAYLNLHKARLKNGLKVVFDLAEDEKTKEVAPLTLQLLVENAIKHNIAAEETPLTINIKLTPGFIEVTNPIHKKESTYSTQLGLKNLVDRYELLSENKVIVKDDGDVFSVKVPLI